MHRFTFILILLFSGCHSAPPDDLRQASLEQTHSYEEFKNEIVQTRNKIKEQYVAADSHEKDSIVGYSAQFLRNMTPEIFNYWYGTDWDFNGITQKPKEGKIACGYFVTTVIRDLGFNIPRSTWAQLPSESMIKKLNSSVKPFFNKPVEAVITWFRNRPDAVYVVGLDTHVGFVYKEGKTLKFVHANYYEPDSKVVSQNLKGNNPINDASYRVVGQLFEAEMVKKWILNEAYE
ncbi:MAG: hypothetical protein ACJ77K_16030 [Bacteroidia bacterium]